MKFSTKLAKCTLYKKVLAGRSQKIALNKTADFTFSVYERRLMGTNGNPTQTRFIGLY